MSSRTRFLAKLAPADPDATHRKGPEDLEQPQPLSSLTTVPAASEPSQPPATSSSSSSTDPPYPPTFAQLAQLIATGAPIPGIKDIPDKLAEGAPSESRESVRRKPWEKEEGNPAQGGERPVGADTESEMFAEEGGGMVAEEGSGQV